MEGKKHRIPGWWLSCLKHDHLRNMQLVQRVIPAGDTIPKCQVPQNREIAWNNLTYEWGHVGPPNWRTFQPRFFQTKRIIIEAGSTCGHIKSNKGLSISETTSGCTSWTWTSTSPVATKKQPHTPSRRAMKSVRLARQKSRLWIWGYLLLWLFGMPHETKARCFCNAYLNISSRLADILFVGISSFETWGYPSSISLNTFFVESVGTETLKSTRCLIRLLVIWWTPVP